MEEIFDYRSQVPADFADNSRVWIYQADRKFTKEEIAVLSQRLTDFNQEWSSHGAKVCSFVHLFFDQFIIMIADENEIKVGGCSTDASYRFLKELEREFGVRVFNRQSMAFVINNDIQLIPITEINKDPSGIIIKDDTLYFNNTILTKKQLIEDWIVPVKNTWLISRIPLNVG